MKNSAIALTLSALFALCFVSPQAQAASTPPPTHATSQARPATASMDQLNARMREDIKQTGKLPDPATLPLPHLPDVELHVMYLVDTNKKGQVVKVRAGHPSPNDPYNTYTYYNALQAFIHRVDGGGTAGVFRLTYDYSPSTKTIKRDVELVQKGGVNPDALGAVDVMKHAGSGAHKPSAQAK